MLDGDPTARRGALRSWARSRAPTLALALAAGAVVFLVSVVVFPYHSTNHDEAVYLQQAAMLLDGQLFLRPPVPEAFRPWFFVRDGSALYAKYTPVAAAVFALGQAVAGSYRVALAAVAAGNVALVAALGREAFDRRTGVLAGGLLLTAPLFVVSSSVFLSYAPTTLFNLAFALAYVRAARADGPPAAVAGRSLGASRRSLSWATAAGVAVGLAFFARPYTAVLFATPFVAHAAYRTFVLRSRRAVAANVATGALGAGFVALALAYNAVVTGDALTFPYQAFAPRDGLGFGTRAILDYSRTYTPALAVRANAEAVARLALRWVPLGLAGTALAAWGARHAFDDGTASEPSPGLPDRTLRALVLAVVPTVVLGNVAFWGTLNVLGDLDAVADGLVWTLGPYYHFDVLVPVALFGAWGGRDLVGRLRARRAAATGPRRHAILAASAVALVLVAAVGTLALAHPVAANYENSRNLAAAYDVDREFDDAVLFLPPIYGDWLHHPLQPYRNDPGYDGDAVYALDRDGENFAVVDAFPDRSYYRYTYRGRWAPFRGESIEPRVQRVHVARGERAGVDLSLGTPEWVVRGAVELTSDEESVAYYVNDTAADIDARLVVEDGQARLVGADVQPQTGNGTIPVAATDTVTTTAFLGGRGSGGVTYRVETPVRAGDGANATAVLTPYLEVCIEFDTCDGGAAYLPSETDPGVNVTVDVWANATTTASARRGSQPVRVDVPRVRPTTQSRPSAAPVAQVAPAAPVAQLPPVAPVAPVGAARDESTGLAGTGERDHLHGRITGGYRHTRRLGAQRSDQFMFGRLAPRQGWFAW